MATDSEDTLRLRAHHICCSRFWNFDYSDRGPEFAAVGSVVRQALRSGERPVQLQEGVDVLCSVCPLRSDDACASPRGNEEQVRKWDAVLARELGVAFGSRMTAGEWRRLVDSKAPFHLCQRCQWRSNCAPGRDAAVGAGASTKAPGAGWQASKGLAPGINARLAWGDRLMLSLVTLDPGSEVPSHSHPHEQAGVVLEGRIRMVIAGKTRYLKKGDAYIVPSGTPHEARPINGPSLVLDAFSPPREEYK